MVERLTIAKLGRRGDGIAETPAGPLYVPYTLPGETVDGRAVARPSRPPPSGRASNSASRERIAPICPHFGTCGGCAMQHWATAHYRAWKRALVIEALREGRARRRRSTI